MTTSACACAAPPLGRTRLPRAGRRHSARPPSAGDRPQSRPLPRLRPRRRLDPPDQAVERPRHRAPPAQGTDMRTCGPRPGGTPGTAGAREAGPVRRWSGSSQLRAAAPPTRTQATVADGRHRPVEDRAGPAGPGSRLRALRFGRRGVPDPLRQPRGQVTRRGGRRHPATFNAAHHPATGNKASATRQGLPQQIAC